MQEPVLTIVGGGRIGGMVEALARAQGQPVRGIGREGPTARPEEQGPVLVCTRNDALEDVLARCPAPRRRDLVLVQNGVLAPWARAQGLDPVGIGVLYVAVDAPGSPPVPGAPSVFGGPHAETLVALLDRGGVPARVARDPIDLHEVVGAKLCWICVMGALGDALDLRVGDLVARHEADIAALCEELAPVLAGEADTAAPADLVSRTLAYSRAVPHYRTAVKEWAWRNGWLLAAATRQGRALPLHRRWLQRGGHPSG